MLPFTTFQYPGYTYYLIGSMIIVEIINPSNSFTGDYHAV